MREAHHKDQGGLENCSLWKKKTDQLQLMVAPEFPKSGRNVRDAQTQSYQKTKIHLNGAPLWDFLLDCTKLQEKTPRWSVEVKVERWKAANLQIDT
jgi:hypothetical protein